MSDNQVPMPPVPPAPVTSSAPAAPAAPAVQAAAAPAKPGRKPKAEKALPKKGFIVTVGPNPIPHSKNPKVIFRQSSPVEVDLDDWVTNQIRRKILTLA